MIGETHHGIILMIKYIKNVGKEVEADQPAIKRGHIEMRSSLIILLIAAIATAVGCGIASSSGKTVDLADLAPATEGEPAAGTETAVFAGGCFWGVEAVFEHVKGVADVRSGYAGGDARSANYDRVSEGETDHAESVEIVYDPSKVTYTQLLTIFFAVAHDPTQLDRQGPDVGRQYRSAIFYLNDAQRKTAAAYIEAIDRSKALAKPVVTQVVPLVKFYPAEGYHQDFMKKNPSHPYILAHDKPKLDDLKKRFPQFYSGK